MLEMKNVYAGYGKQKVLNDVSFTAEKGKLTVIVGKNGSGKSTLLKCIVGLLDYSGEISVSGENLSDISDICRAKEIAYLPQCKSAPNIPVKSLMLHGRFPHLSYPRRYGKKDFEIVSDAMKTVGISEFENKNVSELSGGQQRKVYIAMALVQQTPVILLDEPTTYLDVSEQFRLLELIKKLTEEGKSIVAVMHDLSLALKYADRIAVMDKGEIIVCDNCEAVFESGILERVYGVKIQRIESPEGYRYYIDA